MVLYKQVNGERVKFSVSEETDIRAGWEKNNNDSNAEEIKYKTEERRKAALRKSLTQKLLDLGFTSDEIELIC